MTKSRRLATKFGRFKGRTVCVSTKLLAFGKGSLNIDLLAQQATTRTQKLRQIRTHLKCMSACPSVRSIYLHFYLFLSIYLSIHISISFLSLFLFVSVHPSTYLSVYLSCIFLSIWLAACLLTLCVSICQHLTCNIRTRRGTVVYSSGCSFF
jgi:hypothetical protein